MNKNIKLYSIYRTFSYDIFFYYAISFFYFLTVKELTLTQILFLEALYPILGIVVQIPAATIVKKMGIKNSMIFANVLWIIGFIGYIIAPSILIILFADIIFAIGNAIKQISDPLFLMESLKQEASESEFNKVEGKGIAIYYYIETITSILAGFLFVINPYVPFILGTLMAMVSVLIAIQFNEIEYKQDIDNRPVKVRITEFIIMLGKILRNKRLQALLLFASIFYGIIGINANYYIIFFENFGVNVEEFTLVFSILAIIKGIATQNQYLIERKTKNRTLSWLSMIYILTLISIGLLANSTIQTSIIVGFGICIVIIQNIIEGTYKVPISKYILNFTNMNTAPNIEVTYVIFKNIGRSALLFLSALLIEKTSINNAYLIYGSISFIVMIFIINFMKTRLGLAPEEYKGEETIY